MPRRRENKYIVEREAERRRHEERERELATLRAMEVEAVAAALALDDKDLAEHLVDLGFDAETAPAFQLIPLVYVAWADGDVSLGERRKVLELAEARGMAKTGAAHDFLADLLENRPRKDFFDTCLKAIRRIYEALPDEAAQERAKKDLVSLSMAIAEVSGGFLGLFGDKVSSEEREMLKGIINELGLSDNDATRALLES